MKVATRKVDETLVLDLFGPFPNSKDEHHATDELVRDALAGHPTGFIIVFHEIDFLRSVHLGLLLKWLTTAGVKVGGLGTAPFVRIVAETERVRSAFSVVDSPFKAFATEEEALSSLRS